jgi:hypothetical protein
MQRGDVDSFGVPSENIRAAEKWSAKLKKKRRYQIRVPTRREVRDLPAPELKELLIGWMVHSPIEIVPSQAQISLVVDVLTERHDAADLTDLLAKCRSYMGEH